MSDQSDLKANFKDLFSAQSSDYAKFRPRYPRALFDYLAGLCNHRDRAWDCGTGNGQAAVELARDFGSVVATDPSEKQISSAETNSRVNYRIASAENSGLPAASVDLITVAQAFHWFKHAEFFAEVRRISRPGAVVAIWAYELCKITPEVDAAVMKLYAGTLGGYWEKERKLVEEGYRNCDFPFEELKPPRFEMSADWSFPELIGYLGTWSALQTYRKKNGVNPLEAMAPELKAAWGDVERRAVVWELSLRVGVVK